MDLEEERKRAVAELGEKHQAELAKVKQEHTDEVRRMNN